MKLRTKSLGLLGVEVEGLDLRQSIDEENWFALRELVMAEGVVVFRDQPMESGDQVELGRRSAAPRRVRLPLVQCGGGRIGSIGHGCNDATRRDQ
jgi:alpha-ketoglutarate-dependent taurine dioxygenase